MMARAHFRLPSDEVQEVTIACPIEHAFDM